MLVVWKRISAVLGLAVLGAAPAFAGAPSRNQSLADAVAAGLRQNVELTRSNIDIESREGVVTLSGVVASPAAKADALARARRVPGVLAVVDRVGVRGESPVRLAQYQPMAPGQPMPVGPNAPRLAMGGHHRGGYAGGDMVYDGAAMNGGMIEGGMIPNGAVAGPGMEGPAPEGPAGVSGAMPGQPNYAWPSYAPYPNFSAVGYPTVYPCQAWPNIGPFYPYPEVPLDWRAVTLRWDDGLWWLDFRKHYTRPFFTPYPFGIFGY